MRLIFPVVPNGSVRIRQAAPVTFSLSSLLQCCCRTPLSQPDSESELETTESTGIFHLVGARDKAGGKGRPDSSGMLRRGERLRMVVYSPLGFQEI